MLFWILYFFFFLMWIPGNQHKKKGAAFSHAETHISEGIFKSSKSWCMDYYSLSLVDEEPQFLLSEETEGGSFILSGIRNCYLIYDYISFLLLHLMLCIKHYWSPFSKCYISSEIHINPDQESDMKHIFSLSAERNNTVSILAHTSKQQELSLFHYIICIFMCLDIIHWKLNFQMQLKFVLFFSFYL